MQAIARANRVYPGKSAGIIVDYVNVFKYMKKALTEYATGDDGTEFPAKDIDQLISYIDGTIDEADSFLLSLDIDLKKIIADSNTLDKLDAFTTKDVEAHGYVNTLVYQTAFDEIESELEKFRCQIYKAKYVPVKASPRSGMMRYFGEDSETKGTDE